jgi:hypothetical protein
MQLKYALLQVSQEFCWMALPKTSRSSRAWTFSSRYVRSTSAFVIHMQHTSPQHVDALKRISRGLSLFHQVIDVLLQLVEHDLISDEELPAVRELMLTALSMGERGLAVMGAKGMEVIIVRDGLYTPCALPRPITW